MKKLIGFLCGCLMLLGSMFGLPVSGTTAKAEGADLKLWFYASGWGSDTVYAYAFYDDDRDMPIGGVSEWARTPRLPPFRSAVLAVRPRAAHGGRLP